MVRPLSMARVLRPLPGKRASGQPELETLGSAELAAIGGKGHVVSESIAQILAESDLLTRTAWLRLEPIDVPLRDLVNSLLRAAAHARNGPSEVLAGPPASVDSPVAAGRLLAEHFADLPVLILEDTLPSRATEQAWETIVAYHRHATPGSRVVYLCHGSLRHAVVSAADVVIEGNSGRQPELESVLVDGDAGFSLPALEWLMSQAGNQPSLLSDVLDANAKRDADLVTHLSATSNRYRSMEHRVNARLLPQLSPAEIQALSIAVLTGYWHISLGDQSLPPDITLRPWMVPLESGWWWLRPAWRPSLAKSLDVSRRSGRRFLAKYQRKQGKGIKPALSPRRPQRGKPVVSQVSAERDENQNPDEHASEEMIRRPPSIRSGAGPPNRPDNEVQSNRLGVDSKQPRGGRGGSTRPPTDLLDLIAELQEETRQIRAELEEVRSARERTGIVEESTDSTLIEVRVLGEFSVSVCGQVIEWNGQRARRLFQFLLQHHPRPVNREVLMEAFWPDADPTSSRNCLNAAVHALRQHFRDAGIDEDVVVHDGGAYRFNPQLTMLVDAVSFTQGVDRLLNGRWEFDPDAVNEFASIVALYRGEYLGSEPLHEWAMARRRHLRRLYISAQDVIARTRLDHGEFEACIDACRRITEIEEAHEVAHRRMIVALTRSGRISEAMAQYDVCARSLADDLGVQPSEQTQQLIRDIRSGQFP